MAYSIQKTFCGLPRSCFSGHRLTPFCIPDGSAGDAPFQRRLVDVLAEHLLSSGKQGADQVFGLLGLGFPLRLDAGQHFICGNVVLADPAETTLVPTENASDTPGGGKGTFFFMGQDAHGRVVLQLADEHNATDGGGDVDGAETPLQTLHSSGLVQMPNQQK